MRVFQFLIFTLTTGTLAWSLPTQATLGEDFSPQLAKQAKPGGEMHVTFLEKYTLHEYTMVSGTVVREFVAPNGKVFAVVWKGPTIPDLRQLLGTHFERYAATAANTHLPGHRHLSLNDPHMVIHAHGHQHAFSGMVYLPDLIPAGVTEDELQ
jgi:hypothetical protein